MTTAADHSPTIGAVAALTDFAEKITELSPVEHGFTHLDLAAAMQRAEALNALPATRRGRLHGRIIPVKDLTDVAGMPTSFGSVHRTRPATESAEVVQRLLAEGAIIPGKTATPELGMTGHTEPVGLPAPENPRWPGAGRTPGGSSGGAAAAVGRGLVDIAHGTDGGGSIRIPAAASGLVGFKPSHVAVGGALSVHGVLTRSVDTTAAMHRITPATFGAGTRLKIGVLAQPLLAETTVAPERLALLDRAAGLLSDAGHQVVVIAATAVDAPGLFGSFRRVFSSAVAEVADPVSPIVGWFRELGAGDPPAASIARLEGGAAEVAAAWDVDVTLSPMLAWDAPEIGFFSSMAPAEDFLWQTKWSPWGSLFNMIGGPAITLPVADHAGKLLDLQLGGIRTDNAQLLGVAKQLQGLLTPLAR